MMCRYEWGRESMFGRRWGGRVHYARDVLTNRSAPPVTGHRFLFTRMSARRSRGWQRRSALRSESVLARRTGLSCALVRMVQ